MRSCAPHQPSQEIGGLPCFPSIGKLPKSPDCVVLAVPRESVEASVEECVRAGVGAIVVFLFLAYVAKRVIVDADNKRVIDELRKRRMDVIPLPFDGPIRVGGGMRCAHHPLWRESVLE